MKTSLAFFCTVVSLAALSCSDDDGGVGGGGATTAAEASSTTATSGNGSSSAGDGGGPSAGSGGEAGSAGDGGDAKGAGGDAGGGGDVGAGGDPPGFLAIGLTALRQVTIGELGDGGTASTEAATSESGSILIASLARGDWESAPDAPTDNFGNDFADVDIVHAYAAWPDSATQLFADTNAVGGEGHVFSMTLAPSDEVSLSVVEVRGAASIAGGSWVEQNASNSITSEVVHVDGPAMLVAWWWGSGGVRPVGSAHVAIPGDDFEILPSATGLVSLSENGYIQVAAAYRMVDAAGDYSVSWTTDDEGAQLYLVALR